MTAVTAALKTQFSSTEHRRYGTGVNMNRIGFIGLNAFSESIITAIYRSLPETQVFLYPSGCSHVQKMAKDYPCRTLDDCESVANEAEIVFLSMPVCQMEASSDWKKPRNVYVMASLVPDLSLQQLRLNFHYETCIRVAIINCEENTKPIAILTGSSQHLQRFFEQAGFYVMSAEEHQFNFIIQSL